ncbi:MAG: hypothetical protein CL663_00965 [Bacteroidetes bacterium]|nr:hypothetical protein [Bacteroidota bacterium]
MKRLVNILSLSLIAIILLGACSETKTTKPNSKGKTLEMMVVTNNNEQWNGSIGRQIKEFFGQEQLGLPQVEPLFTFFHLPEDALLDMYKANRDILIVDINSSFQKGQIETRKDHWAAPQRVIKITAPDLESFTEVFEENKYRMLELYHDVERIRIQRAFKSVQNAKIKQALNKNFDINMVFPSNFKIAKMDSTFIWLRNETLKDSQGVMIYIEDYTDMNQLDHRNILRKRNQITRRYIPGPSNGSYMKVADEFIQPVAKDISLNGLFAVEIRALWDVKNDFMGGPFLSYTLVDEERNRTITIDSYVYAPKDRKKILVKQLEAIAYTFEILKEEVE